MLIVRPQDLEVLATAPGGIEEHAGEFVLHVEIAGISMRLRFDDTKLCSQFAARYREHVQPGGDAAIVYSCSRIGDSYYFWSSAIPTAWRWPGSLPLQALVLLVDATAMASLVRSDQTLLSFHAAALDSPFGAVGIVGESTAGKTTTTLACARAGMSVFSDERLLVRGNTVLPFLRAFNIRPHGRALLEADDAADEFAAVMAQQPRELDWTDVSPYEVIPGLRRPQPAALRALFLLQGVSDRASVTELGQAQIMRVLMASADCCASSRLERAARVRALIAGVGIFGLTLGTPADSAALIRSTIREKFSHAA